jgi:hypothetical protein
MLFYPVEVTSPNPFNSNKRLEKNSILCVNHLAGAVNILLDVTETAYTGQPGEV